MPEHLVLNPQNSDLHCTDQSQAVCNLVPLPYCFIKIFNDYMSFNRFKILQQILKMGLFLARNYFRLGIRIVMITPIIIINFESSWFAIRHHLRLLSFGPRLCRNRNVCLYDAVVLLRWSMRSDHDYQLDWLKDTLKWRQNTYALFRRFIRAL